MLDAWITPVKGSAESCRRPFLAGSARHSRGVLAGRARHIWRPWRRPTGAAQLDVTCAAATALGPALELTAKFAPVTWRPLQEPQFRATVALWREGAPMTSLSSSFRSPRSHNSLSFFLLLMVAIRRLVFRRLRRQAYRPSLRDGVARRRKHGQGQRPGAGVPFAHLPAARAQSQSPQKPPTGPSCTDYCSGDDDCSDS